MPERSTTPAEEQTGGSAETQPDASGILPLGLAGACICSAALSWALQGFTSATPDELHLIVLSLLQAVLGLGAGFTAVRAAREGLVGLHVIILSLIASGLGALAIVWLAYVFLVVVGSVAVLSFNPKF